MSAELGKVKAGDWVQLSATDGKGMTGLSPEIGQRYKVLCVDTQNRIYIFDKGTTTEGEVCSCGGRHKWYIHSYNYRLLKDSETNMTITKKLGAMMKKLLDADTQALVKAGYINGDLELTTDGMKALTAIIFTANKAALVADANEVIAEAEAETK
jgi:hypothetical protein